MKEYLENRIQELKEERDRLPCHFLIREELQGKINELEKALTHLNQLKEDKQ